MESKNHYSTLQNVKYIFVCLFFASLNFEMFSPFMEDFSVAKMAAFAYIGISLFASKDFLSVNGIQHPLFYAFAMFFLMVFSSIIHLSDNRSIIDTTLFLNIVMFWLLLNHYRQDNRVFHEGLLWFSISSFVVALFFYFNVGVSVTDDLRVVVFGENANTLGVKMAVGALFLLNYCINHSIEKPIYRPWLLIMLVPMLMLLIATASRVALLIFGAGSIIFVMFRSTKKNGKKILWLILGVLLLIVGYRFILQQDILFNRMNDAIEERNIAGRDYIWEKYMVLIRQHPILGVGFTGTEGYAKEVFGMTKSPHNVLIEVTLYSGVLGLFWFLMFLGCLFKNAWLYCKNKKILAPFMTSMAVLGVVLTGQALNVKLFWVIAAYAISYRVIPEERLG